MRDWAMNLEKREADLQQALNDQSKRNQRKGLSYKDLYVDDSSDFYYSEDDMNEISFQDFDPPKAI